MSGEKLSVGAPYYNAVAGPLAIILGILLAVGPLLSWRRESRPVFGKLRIPAFVAAIALAIAFFALPQASLLSKVGLALAAGLLPAALLPIVRPNPFRAPLATWGMAIAHAGAAVAIAGMAADSSTRAAAAVANLIILIFSSRIFLLAEFPKVQVIVTSFVCCETCQGIVKRSTSSTM